MLPCHGWTLTTDRHAQAAVVIAERKPLVNLVGNGHTGRVVEILGELSRACALALWQALRASPYPPQGLSHARGRHSFWDPRLCYGFYEQ